MVIRDEKLKKQEEKNDRNGRRAEASDGSDPNRYILGHDANEG